jgi:apolipoprotein N-acyltransferase
VLTIITNDGWWGNTPGYQQHMVYASLRAIENRRYIARCANTGISGFIDDEGNILKQSKWWTPDALSEDLKLIPYQTFYTKHGNWIFVIANFLTVLLLFSLFFKNNKLPR